MTPPRSLKWIAGVCLAAIAPAALFFAIYGWNWLLDLNQQDEGARIRIDRLTLDHGTLGYDDAGQKTSIRSELSTSNAGPAGAGVAFTAQGQYKGLPLKVRGTGGPVLGLRDESTPYPLKIDLTVGGTGVKADGTITSLLRFTAMDMRLALRGSPAHARASARAA